MKKAAVVIILSLSLSLLFNTSCSHAYKGSKMPSHPRILLLEGEEAQIRNTIESDAVWQSIHQSILDECDLMTCMPPVERIQIGRRLLDKSREALRRIFYLSYAWRMTGNDKYAERAEEEMLAVAAFSDWNPSHFLDVAEMTMAVSIGYDWLFSKLSPESRKTIRDAIIEKGLKPSLDPQYTWWIMSSNNWNQVCNAGMTFGALAVFEDDPGLAGSLLERADSSIILPMEDYNPDGAYPEGYSYWGYGTSFNIMYLAAVEEALGNISGPLHFPGFFRTGGYLENMTGPSGDCFNYSDCGSGGSLQPAMFWLAGKLGDNSLLWSERLNLMGKNNLDDRLLPAILIWSRGTEIGKIPAPDKNIWVGQGKNPVALMRTSWKDPESLYVGFKAGSPSVNHGHMDAGAFIMEANGERWAMDLGPQNYNSLETAGIDLWNMSQNSQRWNVFRYNNLAHNTLTVNGKYQDVDGNTSIISWSGRPGMLNAVSDLTTLYREDLRKAVRGIAIIDDQYVMVRDEVEALSGKAVIRWNLVTDAEVKIKGNNQAVLFKNGKKLLIKVKDPAAVKMKTWSTTPLNEFDAPNPGTIMVGFETTLSENTSAVLNVLLLPEGAEENDRASSMALSEWPESDSQQQKQ